MPGFVRYNMNGDYTVFSRMKEKGISLAAFATTILFLILTVIMVSVTLQSAYAWLVMGSTLFLFLTLCSYSSCEKTVSSRWRRASMHSDSISTISEGRDNMTTIDYNRSNLPYWITDLPPSYTAATSQQNNTEAGVVAGTDIAQPPPPAYSTVVDIATRGNNSTEHQSQCTCGSANPNTLTVSSFHSTNNQRSSLRDSDPPVQVHSLRVTNGIIRLTHPNSDQSDTCSLDGHLSERERTSRITSDSSSVC